MKDFSRPGVIAAFAMVILCAGGCSSPDRSATENSPQNPGGFVADTKPVPEARWIEATVPQGTTIRLSLIDTLSPETSKQGDVFRTLVTEAVMVGGTVVVPSGSNILGRVGEVSPTSLQLQFERIDTPTGASAALKARLADAKQGGDRRALMSTAPMAVVLEEPLLIRVKQ